MHVRVLLVDAHEDARETLARRLRRDQRLELAGEVATVEEAGTLLENEQVDLLLLDVPSHEGAASTRCRDLRQLSDAAVVVLASFMTDEDWATLRQAGAADYVLKNADSEQLCDTIVRLANRHHNLG